MKTLYRIKYILSGGILGASVAGGIAPVFASPAATFEFFGAIIGGAFVLGALVCWGLDVE